MCSLCSLNSVCQCGLKRDAHHQDVTPAPTHNHDKKQKWDADTCTVKVPADCFGLITFDGFGQEASKKAPVSYFSWKHHFKTVSRQLVYGHFVYDTSSTDISSTDISSTMTFLAEIEAGVMKRILYQ